MLTSWYVVSRFSPNCFNWEFLLIKGIMRPAHFSLSDKTDFNYPCWTLSFTIFRNDPKFSDRQVCANSADLDQTATLIKVSADCHSISIIWTHNSMINPQYSNFRMITGIFGVSIFYNFTVNDPNGYNCTYHRQEPMHNHLLCTDVLADK